MIRAYSFCLHFIGKGFVCHFTEATESAWIAAKQNRHDQPIPRSRSVEILDAIKLKATLYDDGSDPTGAQRFGWIESSTISTTTKVEWISPVRPWLIVFGNLSKSRQPVRHSPARLIEPIV
jgi:hypothetical protein